VKAPARRGREANERERSRDQWYEPWTFDEWVGTAAGVSFKEYRSRLLLVLGDGERYGTICATTF
jgi:hypothetical protein